ncbi:MAG TPA: GTP 3',8-cyclase MoaA [Kofleriaceae bacterium]|nr:GTP 3',8-cyclase MoaA [Kofleriaceae bacterium]
MVTPRVQLPVVRDGVAAGPVPRDPLVDGFARRIRYLRISVTDRCNYRCAYCMPETLVERVTFQPRAAVLTFEELERLAALFARLGVRKLRLTGGEPTVRHGIVELVARLAAVPGIEQVVMTSNGHLLGELAGPLARAGLRAVNISLDTLDPDRFRAVTGRGELARVLAGIDAARAAGLRVKTNAVALHGVNDGELVALCEDAWRRGAVPRFIEHMPMSDGALYEAGRGVTAAAIRRTIEQALGPLVAAGADQDAGPARYWTVCGDRTRQLGIISAMTEHFCDDCNRLRLTATGELHACLGHDDAVSLRDLARAGASDDDLVRAIASAVRGKRAGHAFSQAPPATHMIGIGG